MPHTGESATDRLQPISPFAVLGEIWEGRYFVAAVVALLVAVTTAFTLLTYQPVYRSTAILEKRHDLQTQSPNVSPLLLARLTGTSQYTLYEQFIAELGTITLAEHVEQKYHVLPRLYPKLWNNAEQEWVKPHTLRVWLKDTLAPVFHIRPWHHPDAEDLRDYIQSQLVIETTDASDLFKISYGNRDRQLSYDFLNDVVTEVDGLLKERAEQQLGNRVELLSKLLADTKPQALQTALVDQSIAEEVRRLVIEADVTYSVGVVDMHASLRPISPRWIFYWGVATAIGILAGILLLFVRNGLNQYRGVQPLRSVRRQPQLPVGSAGE